MVSLDRQHFGHRCNDVRLRDRLTAGYRQRPIFIGVGALVARDKGLARDVTERLENPRIAHAAPGDLALDHLDAQLAVVHGVDCTARG
jgi:hypothetical protein